MILHNKKVLLGISGGIAAYKTPDLVRKLKAAGADVRIILTDSAREFVSELSLQAVAGHPISQSLLDPNAEAAMGHIELAKWCDFMLIAPATANIIGKCALGLADDLLSTCFLATNAPVAFAPAMNQQMWAQPSVQNNCQRLQDHGALMFGPGAGEQACGDVGFGRMLEPDELVSLVSQQLQAPALLAGKQVLITAGPTREAIDPVRYLSNHSSGKMGFALAQQAVNMGATVTLIAGPVSLPTPFGVTRIDVESAAQMYAQVMSAVNQTDVFIACAAVADYRVVEPAEQKIKKSTEQADLTLNLVENPDILASVAALAQRPFVCGFAAETNQVETYAKEKLKRKKLDLIAANDVSAAELGFGSDENALIVISNDETEYLPQQSKLALAQQLLTIIAQKS